MPATLRLYTDFVCPFCFIAEESTVPRLLRELDLTLEWNGFELHPETPRGGLPLSQLFPGIPLQAMHARTTRFAQSFGVTGFDPPDFLPNTRRALGMAELARDRRKLDPFRKAAFDAYWRHGRNLEAEADLRDLAEAVGLDGDEARRASEDPILLARVDARQAQARRAGVTGIPTFVFAGASEQTVVGCQPYEALAAAATRAGARRRT